MPRRSPRVGYLRRPRFSGKTTGFQHNPPQVKGNFWGYGCRYFVALPLTRHASFTKSALTPVGNCCNSVIRKTFETRN